jgi:hypothetical protein
MSGKCNHTSISGIITSQADTASTLTFSFSSVCSFSSYDPSTKILKDSAETLPLNVSFQVFEVYNTPLSTDRLRHHPPTSKEFLLFVYSCIWTENLIPAAWRKAAVA